MVEIEKVNNHKFKMRQFMIPNSVDLEPLPYEVSSIEECQDWGRMVHSLGAEYFYYNGVTEECQMFSSMQPSCSAVGGPEDAPPLDECRG